MSEIRGVDLSHWRQDLTNGEILSNADMRFAILKLTEGRTIKDESFSAHYVMCAEQNIPVGAFVYTHATSAAIAKAEAEFALQTLAGRKLELPIFIDIEAPAVLSAGREKIAEVIKAFGDTMRAAGHKVGVYASKWIFDVYIDHRKLKNEGWYIWCAAYNNVGAGMTCDIWQYTDHGRLDGYNADLDLNILYNTAMLDSEYIKPRNEFWPPRTIDAGMSGPDVSVWQALMIARGYECEITGEFDYNTLLATLAFQRDAGVADDGIPGPVTWGEALRR